MQRVCFVAHVPQTTSRDVSWRTPLVYNGILEIRCEHWHKAVCCTPLHIGEVVCHHDEQSDTKRCTVATCGLPSLTTRGVLHAPAQWRFLIFNGHFQHYVSGYLCTIVQRRAPSVFQTGLQMQGQHQCWLQTKPRYLGSPPAFFSSASRFLRSASCKVTHIQYVLFALALQVTLTEKGVVPILRVFGKLRNLFAALFDFDWDAVCARQTVLLMPSWLYVLLVVVGRVCPHHGPGLYQA